MDLSHDVLLAVLRNRIDETDREAGLARLRGILGSADDAAIAATVSQQVAAGLLHDPVRLEPGALQCHWRLELTPAGYAEIEHLLPRPDAG